jgi:hypothetical protein
MAEADNSLNFLGPEMKQEVEQVASQYMRSFTFVRGEHPRVKITEIDLHLTIDGEIEVIARKKLEDK